MRPEDIFEAFSDIDEELIAGAKHIEGGDSQVIVIKPAPLWKKILGWSAAAACLVVLVVGGIFGIKYFSGKNALTPPASGTSDGTSTWQSDCQAYAPPEYPEAAKYVYTGDYSELEPFKHAFVDYVRYYDSLVSLEEVSDLIVIGEFTDDPHQLFDPNEPNTGSSYNKFRIDKVVKGSCFEGEEIIICQDGVVGGSNFYYTDNYTPMLKGDKWIYFLRRIEDTGYYYPVHDTGRYPVPGEEHEFVLSDNVYGVFREDMFRADVYEEIKKRLPDWKYEVYFESEYPDGAEVYSGDYSGLEVKESEYGYGKNIAKYEELFNDQFCEFIVAGEFIDDTHQWYMPSGDEYVGRSYNKFRVDKVYKGDIKKGQVIIIEQESFVVDGAFYNADNMTPMVNGDKWLYCLTKENGICSAYDGGNGRYPIPGSGNRSFDFADGYYGVCDTEYANIESYERLLNELDIAVTKNFDGVVLSVMADSGSLNVTAAVRNTTDKPIGLLMPCQGENTHTEISTTISRGSITLADVSAMGGDTAMGSHIVQPGEEYVQKMSFAVPLKDSISSGYEVGEYKGVASIALLADPHDTSSEITQRLVEFGMTIREQNIVSKDFDGVVLTVSTNGKTFKAGEDFKVTATVRNDTNKPIGLWMPVTGEGSHKEITTHISRGIRSLLDIDVAGKSFAEACDSHIIQPGGVYVQEMTFSTFTGWYSDYAALYDYGEYNGTATIKLLSDPNDTSSEIIERLVEFTIEIVDENSEIKPNEVKVEIERVYSDLLNTGNVDWEMEEFLGIKFRCDGDSVSALTEGVKDENGKEQYAVQSLYSGMPVMDVYLVDLNYDGKREIVSTVAYGSGIVDEHIEAYDFANNVHYTLEDRMQYDYALKFKDGKLLVKTCRYGEYEIMNEQTLTFNMLRDQPDEMPVSVISHFYDGGSVSWVMEEFPNVTFYADTSSVNADNGSKEQLYADVIIESVMLCDLNGDDKREIISQMKKGGTSGVRMYDYANGECYELWADNMHYLLNSYNDAPTVEVRSEDALEHISKIALTGGKLEYIAERVTPADGQ